MGTGLGYALLLTGVVRPAAAPSFRPIAAENGPTVFATHSTHKLLAALSQSSYIHVREGRSNVPHIVFNESYMMYATTSPLYAIIASNDTATAMMDGPVGTGTVEYMNVTWVTLLMRFVEGEPYRAVGLRHTSCDGRVMGMMTQSRVKTA
jgi:hypothetical protein